MNDAGTCRATWQAGVADRCQRLRACFLCTPLHACTPPSLSPRSRPPAGMNSVSQCSSSVTCHRVTCGTPRCRAWRRTAKFPRVAPVTARSADGCCGPVPGTSCSPLDVVMSRGSTVCSPCAGVGCRRAPVCASEPRATLPYVCQKGLAARVGVLCCCGLCALSAVENLFFFFWPRRLSCDVVWCCACVVMSFVWCSRREPHVHRGTT